MENTREKLLNFSSQAGRVIVDLEKIEAVLSCIMDDGPYSYDKSYYESNGWEELTLNYSNTGSLLNVMRDYIEQAITNTREAEKAIFQCMKEMEHNGYKHEK